MDKLFSPRRPLGRTGFVATQLGIGDLADRALAVETLAATARRAMDAGLNLIDTAPMYENGYSEEVVGRAVRGRRESMFVIDKVDQLDQPVAAQVDESLGRLKLDFTDAFVFHALSALEGWRRLSAPGGGMEQLRGCIAAGKCRFAGISSHDPAVLTAALRSGLCDIVMFPVGPFVDARYIERVLPLAKELGVGTVCFKTFGAGKLLADTDGYNRPLTVRPRGKRSSGGRAAPGGGAAPVGAAAPGSPVAPAAAVVPGGPAAPLLPRLSVEECVHYTLTCDPDVALLGLSYPNEQDAAFAAAKTFRPLGADRMADIRRRAAVAIEGKGENWWNPKKEG